MRVFRKLLPAERGKLRDHLLRLSAEDRSLRFAGALSEAAVAGYCDRIDWWRGYVVGCFVAGVLRGVAELRFVSGPFSARGEAAVSVETEWQDQGIGFELLRRALVIARNRSIRTISMICLLDNWRMRRIAENLADLHMRAGEMEADIVVPLPTHLSLYEEAAADGFALLGAWLDGIPGDTRA